MENQKEQVSSRFGKSNVRRGAAVSDPHQPEIFMGIAGDHEKYQENTK